MASKPNYLSRLSCLRCGQIWDVAAEGTTSVRSGVMDAAGHRSDVRCVAISPDNALVCYALQMAAEL